MLKRTAPVYSLMQQTVWIYRCCLTDDYCSVVSSARLSSRRWKSAEKNAATAEFVKFCQPTQKLRLIFGWYLLSLLSLEFYTSTWTTFRANSMRVYQNSAVSAWNALADFQREINLGSFVKFSGNNRMATVYSLGLQTGVQTPTHLSEIVVMI